MDTLDHAVHRQAQFVMRQIIDLRFSTLFQRLVSAPDLHIRLPVGFLGRTGAFADITGMLRNQDGTVTAAAQDTDRLIREYTEQAYDKRILRKMEKMNKQ